MATDRRFNDLADYFFLVEIFLRRSASSIAESAESQPRFPCFVPARSMACSIVSVVSTPKTTGISVSSATRPEDAGIGSPPVG